MTDENIVRSGRCDPCGAMIRGHLCARCARATVRVEAIPKMFEGLPEPTELEKKRLARLSPMGLFMVPVMFQSWRRSGAPVTLSEAISQVEEVKRQRAK